MRLLATRLRSISTAGAVVFILLIAQNGNNITTQSGDFIELQP